MLPVLLFGYIGGRLIQPARPAVGMALDYLNHALDHLFMPSLAFCFPVPDRHRFLSAVLPLAPTIDRKDRGAHSGLFAVKLNPCQHDVPKSFPIPLGSHPESFQFEEKGDQVYVNVPKQLGVALVDRRKRLVFARWGLGASFANYPMAVDNANKRLFVGCRLPARFVVLDTVSGRIVDTLPTVGDTDDIFYDTNRRLVYVIGGEGAVETLRQRDPDHYERAGRTVTAQGARTGFFLENSGHLYVAVPHRGSQAAKVLVYTIEGS